MTIRFVGLLALCIAGCSSPIPECRCEGNVPGGTLNAACGQTQCVADVRYLCTEPNAATPMGACTVAANDGGVPIDAPVAADAGPPLTPTFMTFLDNAQLGVVEDIWTASARDAWFVTSSGRVLRWTGGTTTDAWEFADPLHAVHGTDATHVWVAGEGGTIANFDGAEGFDRVDTTTRRTAFFGAWGDTSTRYVAGELFGMLWRASGTEFASYAGFQVEDGRGGRAQGETRCVTGSAGGIWVCGDDGFYGYDGAWHRIYGGTAVDAVAVGGSYAIALDERDAWLVDFREIALSGAFGPHGLPRPDGIEDVRGPRLRGIWGDANEAWVVGTEGYVARITNYTDPFASWERIDSGTTRDLESIAVDAEAIWIGGDSIILRRAR